MKYIEIILTDGETIQGTVSEENDDGSMFLISTETGLMEVNFWVED